jgi:oligopeptide/dipeptide ABC transporter ATP-binding protein
LRAFVAAPTGALGLLGSCVILAIAGLGPVFLNGRASKVDFAHTYAPVSFAHPLGTDSFGRDMLARVVVASRLSLELGLSAALIGLILGALLGMVAALATSWLRPVLLRGIDALLSFPSILTAIVVSTVIGLGAKGAVLGVGIALIFPMARLTSTLALSVGGREYVNGARVLGVKRSRLLLRYVLPNIAEPLVVAFSLMVVTSILAVSALSFLGLGVQAPQFDWGLLLTDGVKAIYLAPASALGPAAAIAITALTLGFTGEAFARAFNPVLWTTKQRSRRRDRAGTAGLLAPPDHAKALAPALQRSESAFVADDEQRALDVRDMVVSFPGAGKQRIEIIKSVSFTVHPGEVVGIVGESGSGKTMTALAIAQLIPFPGEVTGTIKLYGKDLRQLRRKELSRFLSRELAFVFQDPLSSLNPAMRIGAQMTLPIRIHQKLRRSEAYKLAASKLREVHIGAAERQLHRYPHEISGGMRQRVMIATGLMVEPALLIADEPTTALDVTVQAEIMALLAEIKSSHRNTAILLISHNLALVSQNCHRVLVMYAGRIVEDLDVEQLKTDSRHPYTAALVSSIPEVGHSSERSLVEISGEPPDIANLPSGCPFHPRCPLAEPICTTVVPPLLTRTSERGRRVACHVANADLQS